MSRGQAAYYYTGGAGTQRLKGQRSSTPTGARAIDLNKKGYQVYTPPPVPPTPKKSQAELEEIANRYTESIRNPVPPPTLYSSRPNPLEGKSIIQRYMDSQGGTYEDALAYFKATAPHGSDLQSSLNTLTDVQAYQLQKDSDMFRGQLQNLGYSEEEIEDLGFSSSFDTGSYIQDSTIDFDTLFSDFRDFEKEQDEKFASIYYSDLGSKRDEAHNVLSQLKTESPALFSEQYSSSSLSLRNSFAHQEYKKGNLTKNNYKNTVVNNLIQDGKKVIELEGDYYYYEPAGGSNETSFNKNAPQKFYEISFFEDQFQQDSPQATKVAGKALYRPMTGNEFITGTDALGQPIYGGSLDVDAEGKNFIQSNSFENYGIGSRGKQVDPFEQGIVSEFVSDFAILRAPLAIATGGVSEAVIAGSKLLTGETLKTEDYVSLAMTGLQQSGMLKAPVSEAQAADAGTQAMNAANAAGATTEAAMAAGQAAQDLALAGQGIAGFNYVDTVGLLNVAATGNPESFIINKLGNEALDKAFATVDMDSRLLDRFQADDVKSGLVKSVEELSRGKDLENALAAGLGKYIKEGGGANLDFGGGLSVSFGDMGEFLEKALDPLVEIAEWVADKAEPLVDTFEDIARPIGDVAEDVAQYGGDIVEDAAQFTGDIAEDFAQATGDVLSDLDTVIRQNLPNISAPDIDLPSIDLPSLNIPNFNPNLGQFSLVSDTGVSTPSPTRTTDQIFGDDLFKFETEIGISYPNEEEYVDLEANPFNDSLELELTYPDSTEESDGFFEGTIYEQQPRSYNF